MNNVELRRALADLLADEPRRGVDAAQALARGRAARRARNLKVSAAGAAVMAIVVLASVPVSRSFVLGEQAHPTKPVQTPQPAPTSSLTTRTVPYDGYPDSIAVIGHTTAMGRASSPTDVGADVRANSFVTGTNPAVQSVYARILAQHPQIRGHATNISSIDNTIDNAAVQAAQAAAMGPPPDLVIFQELDLDIPCPAGADDVARYRERMAAALQVLQQAAPNTRVLVLSWYGSPTTWLQALNAEQRVTFAGQMIDSGFACSTLTRSGALDANGLAKFEGAIHSFEQAVRDACAQFPLCRFDGDIFGNVVEANEDIPLDFVHLTVKGQAKAAAAAWAALQHAGLVPATK